jgi:phosphatidylinositol alpha-1,6-mannosyltransferase
MGLGQDEFLIASYSRLVPRKGMDTLIRASMRLAERFVNLRVVIGGAGRDRARLERLVAKLGAPVTFLGRVDDDLLPRWIAASDLMVMDCRSRWFGLEQEGFGIVFVEAAACALAQVAGRSGGSDEAVINGVTGVVVANSRSDRDLANAIGDLVLDDRRRAAFAQRSREVALSNYSWDVLAQELSIQLAPFDHFNAVSTLL